eukprot:360113-Chlamydomonas_euryale.AAC.4
MRDAAASAESPTAGCGGAAAVQLSDSASVEFWSPGAVEALDEALEAAVAEADAKRRRLAAGRCDGTGRGSEDAERLPGAAADRLLPRALQGGHAAHGAHSSWGGAGDAATSLDDGCGGGESCLPDIEDSGGAAQPASERWRSMRGGCRRHVCVHVSCVRHHKRCAYMVHT